MQNLGPQQTAAAGTTAAPGWSFIGLTGTGMLAGTQTIGGTSYQFLGLAVNGADVGRFVAGSFGIGTTTPKFQIHTYGAGQSTPAVNTAGTVGTNGGMILAQDANGSAGNGGAFLFAAAQGIFAALKGLLTNGSGNTQGDVVLSQRAAAGDAALTGRWRWVTDGTYRPEADLSQAIGSASLRISVLFGGILNLTGSTAPTSSADTSGAVGDVRLVGNTLYWKTSSGWVKAVGSTF